MSATSKPVTAAVAKPLTPEEGGVKGWLKEHQVTIGMGIALLSAIALIVGLTLAPVGGHVYDTSKQVYLNSGDKSLFDVANHIRNTGITASVLGGLGVLLGAYLIQTAKKKKEDESDNKTSLSNIIKNFDKETAINIAAVVLAITLLVGLNLASAGGDVFESAKHVNYNAPDLRLFDLGKDIRDAGIALSILGGLGLIGSCYYSNKWRNERMQANHTRDQNMMADTRVDTPK